MSHALLPFPLSTDFRSNPLARTREKNVTAAQWSANGKALGASDLTAPDALGWANNVFSPAAQKEVLPEDVYAKLQPTVAHGDEINLTLADQVANAMKEWAMA